MSSSVEWLVFTILPVALGLWWQNSRQDKRMRKQREELLEKLREKERQLQTNDNEK